ncbi:hypothetical protein EDD18DRAFT_1112022 [Armillaria luteobubalina]|uniref:Uncharacterized protein n=1 Tax=Armillaria luteobubalina TaxID=153913 RepID=A0AA39PI02_9AGAR|nr:hypothetical protein EDD18DRAFT_1112022 [Armillaria luteobubalina]
MDRQVVTIFPVFPCDESVDVFILFAPPALAVLAAPVVSPAVPALPAADAGAVEESYILTSRHFPHPCSSSHFFDILLLLLPIATLSIILSASISSNVRARNFSWLVQFAPVAVAQVNSGTTSSEDQKITVDGPNLWYYHADTDIQKRVQNIQERFKSGTLNGTLKKWTKLQITQEASVSKLLIRNAISIGKVGITSLFLHEITEGIHPEIESTLVIDA